jgi:hypothetical protein
MSPRRIRYWSIASNHISPDRNNDDDRDDDDGDDDDDDDDNVEGDDDDDRDDRDDDNSLASVLSSGRIKVDHHPIHSSCACDSPEDDGVEGVVIGRTVHVVSAEKSIHVHAYPEDEDEDEDGDNDDLSTPHKHSDADVIYGFVSTNKRHDHDNDDNNNNNNDGDDDDHDGDDHHHHFGRDDHHYGKNSTEAVGSNSSSDSDNGKHDTAAYDVGGDSDDGAMRIVVDVESDDEVDECLNMRVIPSFSIEGIIVNLDNPYATGIEGCLLVDTLHPKETQFPIASMVLSLMIINLTSKEIVVHQSEDDDGTGTSSGCVDILYDMEMMIVESIKNKHVDILLETKMTLCERIYVEYRYSRSKKYRYKVTQLDEKYLYCRDMRDVIKDFVFNRIALIDEDEDWLQLVSCYREDCTSHPSQTIGSSGISSSSSKLDDLYREYISITSSLSKYYSAIIGNHMNNAMCILLGIYLQAHINSIPTSSSSSSSIALATMTTMSMKSMYRANYSSIDVKNIMTITEDIKKANEVSYDRLLQVFNRWTPMSVIKWLQSRSIITCNAEEEPPKSKRVKKGSRRSHMSSLSNDKGSCIATMDGDDTCHHPPLKRTKIGPYSSNSSSSSSSSGTNIDDEGCSRTVGVLPPMLQDRIIQLVSKEAPSTLSQRLILSNGSDGDVVDHDDDIENNCSHNDDAVGSRPSDIEVVFGTASKNDDDDVIAEAAISNPIADNVIAMDVSGSSAMHDDDDDDAHVMLSGGQGSPSFRVHRGSDHMHDCSTRWCDGGRNREEISPSAAMNNQKSNDNNDNNNDNNNNNISSSSLNFSIEGSMVSGITISNWTSDSFTLELSHADSSRYKIDIQRCMLMNPNIQLLTPHHHIATTVLSNNVSSDRVDNVLINIDNDDDDADDDNEKEEVKKHDNHDHDDYKEEDDDEDDDNNRHERTVNMKIRSCQGKGNLNDDDDDDDGDDDGDDDKTTPLTTSTILPLHHQSSQLQPSIPNIIDIKPKPVKIFWPRLVQFVDSKSFTMDLKTLSRRFDFEVNLVDRYRTAIKHFYQQEGIEQYKGVCTLKARFNCCKEIEAMINASTAPSRTNRLRRSLLSFLGHCLSMFYHHFNTNDLDNCSFSDVRGMYDCQWGVRNPTTRKTLLEFISLQIVLFFNRGHNKELYVDGNLRLRLFTVEGDVIIRS